MRSSNPFRNSPWSLLHGFDIAPMAALGACAKLGQGQGAANEFEPSWQINDTDGFWESENHRNLLFF
jgi:hypothetical protein